MSEVDQAPGWLRRSDARQAFVVTLCSTADLDVAVAALQAEITELVLLEPASLRGNACELVIECLPAEAWSLLQSLRGLPAADVYLQPRDRQPMRVLICDMDMTIVAAETLDEVAAELGLGERIAEITRRAMHGEIDFNSALRERIAMLRGQPEQVFHDIVDKLELNPGAEALLAAAGDAGVHSVLISGGFAQVAEPVARRLGFDEVVCNQLEVEDGQLTGAVIDPIVNADYKLSVLQRVARDRGCTLDQCCAIGDGANDLPMVRAAGLGIAYYGKPVLRAASDCCIDSTDLASVVHFMRLARD